MNYFKGDGLLGSMVLQLWALERSWGWGEFCHWCSFKSSTCGGARQQRLTLDSSLMVNLLMATPGSLLLPWYPKFLWIGCSWRTDSDGKESACSTGDLGWILGWGRSPGEGIGSPLQYSCLKNPMDRGAWQAYSPWGRKSCTRFSS